MKQKRTLIFTFVVLAIAGFVIYSTTKAPSEREPADPVEFINTELGPIPQVIMSRDQTKLLVRGERQPAMAFLYDKISGKQLLQYTMKTPIAIQEMGITADEKFLVAMHGSQATVWSLPTATEIRTLRVEERFLFVPSVREFPALAATHKGTQLMLINAETNAIVMGIPFEPPYQEILAIAPNGQYIMGKALDEAIGYGVWDTHSGKGTAQIPGVPQTVQFAPDSQSLLTYTEGTGTLWALPSGTQTQQIQIDTETQPPILCWAPDSQTLFVGDIEGRLYSPKSGSHLGTLPKPDTAITSAVFRLDGQELITGHADGSLHWWAVSEFKKPQER